MIPVAPRQAVSEMMLTTSEAIAMPLVDGGVGYPNDCTGWP